MNFLGIRRKHRDYTALPDNDMERSFLCMPNPISFRYFKTSPEIIQLAVML